MEEIVLTDNYKISRLDKRNIVVMKYIQREKKDTKEIYHEWVIDGYHGTLKEALSQASRELLDDKLLAESNNLEELKVKFDNFSKEIKEIISNVKIKL